MNSRTLGGGLCLLLLTGGLALAQQPAGDYVTREEYDKLKKELDAVRTEMRDMKSKPAPAAPGAGQAEVDQALDKIEQDIRGNRRAIDELRVGSSRLFIAGDAAVGFTAQKGATSTFFAGVAPLFLWRFNDRLLFEAGLDIGVGTDDTGASSTSVDLTLANVSYLVNDYIAVGAGLFVVPFGVYHPHFDPPWITKLPDDPLVFSDGGLAPGEQVGVFATGGVPVGNGMKINYGAYVNNGPTLITGDPTVAGSLDFGNYTDLNNNKAIGGRIGFQPIPQLEVGYSIQWAKVNPRGFESVHALLQAIDFAYRRDVDWLKGTIDLRGEWVFSQVTSATYDVTGTGTFDRFGSNRNGGYAQVAYRPSKIGNDIVKNLELILRYDRMSSPLSVPGGDKEDRWELGLDYWVAPNAVLKAAYEWDHKRVGDNANAFMMQFGLGL